MPPGSALRALLVDDLELFDAQAADLELVNREVPDRRTADREAADGEGADGGRSDREGADGHRAASARAGQGDAGCPDRARYETKETIALAFVVGLQHLPPQQRAVLVLRDVLGFRAEEAAEMLDSTAPSVNSLLRRARAAFESRLPAAGRERAPLPNSKLERDVVASFADAIEAGDIDTMVTLLTDDAWLTMPPEPWEYQGPTAIGAFLRDREVRRGAPLRLVPTRANSQPAFGCYLPIPNTDIARPRGLFVLTLDGDRISAITWFADTSVFPQFGLPRTLR